MKKESFSTPLDMKAVRINDEFWSREQELVRKEVIPYQWDALNDNVPGAAPSYCMHNFRAAGKLMRAKKDAGRNFVAPKYTFRGFETLPDDPKNPDEDKFYGFVFQDTDFSKWIEAVGYSLINHPNPELEKIADGAIDIVCDAQLDNGYLDTYYIINGMDRAFTNLRDHHELYCLGHLVEGAVSYFNATGKDKLLKAAMRFADYCSDYFGPGEGQCKGYPGHEIAEMALVRLYEVTGSEKYLKLAEFFINQRGKAPIYFIEEEKRLAGLNGENYKEPVINENSNWFERNRYWYHQAHKPVREQSEAVGHAVRGVYLYSGMADVARLTADDELFEACRRIWNSIVREKLYITGGIGASHMGESFSFPYDLPNDTAYSETCAAIGLVFFARRMLQIEAKAEYADVMELALYNTVLAGMALDGKSFFYVNPLEVDPVACDRDERKLHVKAVRQKWFGCACCPPNIARTLSSFSMYAYTENENTLFTHLYVGSSVKKKVEGGELSLETTSDLPWKGSSRIKVKGTSKVNAKADSGVEATLAFRIPGWSKNYTLTVTGTEYSEELRDGYLYITSLWSEAVIDLSFDMEVQFFAVNNAVREDLGKIAVKRGPITYCLEEADNGKNLHLIKVDPQNAASQINIGETDELGHKMTVISFPGKREIVSAADGLYYDVTKEIKYEDCNIRLIPYYAWNNRGKGEMSVFMRRM